MLRKRIVKLYNTRVIKNYSNRSHFFFRKLILKSNHWIYTPSQDNLGHVAIPR